ncbi:exodeoxyribonuclease III [Sphingomonas sp. ASY06-1R]|uniref:exodeoxyribonuclease III n=1 Tax=Sphingomonas sp. ASY06-1R TaxID=3445771 RepID=UPI003FA2ABE9
MRIATYNVNGISARLPRLLEWLEETQTDIVCLQELKAPDERFPEAEIAAVGYNAVWHGQKSWNGVAILARGQDIALRRKGLPDDPDEGHSRYIEAEVNGLIIGGLYLPNGNPVPGPKFDYKIAWFEALLAHARTLFLTERPVVLAGDWNVIPTDHKADVFSASRMAADALMQPESRSCFFRLNHAGWTDALRALHPDEALYTFWDYTMNAWARDAGFRIDHLMLSPAAADRLVEAGVDKTFRGREKASDHAPTWINIRPT